MKRGTRAFWLTMAVAITAGCSPQDVAGTPAQVEGEIPLELESLGDGPYRVGSTNMEVAQRWSALTDDATHEILLGKPSADDASATYIADLLAYPDDAWLLHVEVPDIPQMYGPVSGRSMPLLSYIVYPSGHDDDPAPYDFPYQDSAHGTFFDMLEPGEKPIVADAGKPFPLVVFAHGYASHGIYEIAHAQELAAHGYIVAVLDFGDLRTAKEEELNHHIAYLRPLMTRAVIDSLLASDDFGQAIDANNIGIGGHSYGGFTGLATAGGRYLGDARTAFHPGIKALSLAAPWTGGDYDGKSFYPFGEGHRELRHVSAPAIIFFGTRDEDTTADYVLPATRQTSGPMYVIELIDEPHIFSPGAWQDRNQWELRFFNAYLKGDRQALEDLAQGTSMKDGGNDRQHVEYQRVP